MILRCFLLLFGASLAIAQLPRPVVVNVDHRGNPLQPAFDLESTGKLHFVWNTYANHQERLMSTSFDAGRRARTMELGPGAGVYWTPIVLAEGEDLWVVWQQRNLGEWRVVSRRFTEGRWNSSEWVSERGRDALIPAAEVVDGQLFTAWEDHGPEPGPQRVVMRSGRQVSIVSQPEKPCYRPAFGETPAGLWLFWDCYEGKDYSVYGRVVAPKMGPIERISGHANAQDAVGRYGADAGLAVAWVEEDQVLGKGALDQWHHVGVSVLREGEWSEPERVADLGHSLLSRIEPEVEPIWGFAGRRLHPMLVEDAGSIWLLWERKVEHSGRSTLPAELSGRHFDGMGWGEPVKLHEGLVRYEVPGSAAVRDGVLTLSGFDTQHNLYAFELGLADAAEHFTPTVLTGWENVELPLEHWVVDERPAIEVGGVEHKLYWGDLHVHTTLTADAEGEVDEMMHFARDKARIDIVVMQENDAASWLNGNNQGNYRGQVLTDSEYALSVYFSRRYTVPGRFVALPGFEWSDRLDDGTANHRTVIYAGEDTPLLRHTEEDDFDALCDMVEAAGGVMNSQHPTFRLVDRPCDANIEVAAGWGVYINEPAKIHKDLSDGFAVGFVGTSDGHRRNPGTGGGLTGFWLPELTADAALAALKERRVYATNGSRIVLDAWANGMFMGQDVKAEGAVELTAEIEAPTDIRRIVLLRDGEEVYVQDGGSAGGTGVQFRDEPEPGFHWYYWRVELEGESPQYPGNIKVAEGHLGWSSPHRVFVE